MKTPSKLARFPWDSVLVGLIASCLYLYWSDSPMTMPAIIYGFMVLSFFLGMAYQVRESNSHER